MYLTQSVCVYMCLDIRLLSACMLVCLSLCLSACPCICPTVNRSCAFLLFFLSARQHECRIAFCLPNRVGLCVLFQLPDYISACPRSLSLSLSLSLSFSCCINLTHPPVCLPVCLPVCIYITPSALLMFQLFCLPACLLACLPACPSPTAIATTPYRPPC